MNEFKFIGSHQSISIEGIKFVKDQVVRLNADDTKLLKSSGFYHAFVSQGELVALNDSSLDDVPAKVDKADKPNAVKSAKSALRKTVKVDDEFKDDDKAQ